MAGMKRFVTYIYSYEDKKKGNNTGFAKIEIRGNDGRMEIHLRGAYPGRMKCKVYLFAEDAGDMVGVPLGELSLQNGMGDCSVLFQVENIGGTDANFFAMEGIILIGEEQRIFLSRWTEGNPIEVCAERFRVREKSYKEREMPKNRIQPEISQSEPAGTQPEILQGKSSGTQLEITQPEPAGTRSEISQPKSTGTQSEITKPEPSGTQSEISQPKSTGTRSEDLTAAKKEVPQKPGESKQQSAVAQPTRQQQSAVTQPELRQQSAEGQTLSRQQDTVEQTTSSQEPPDNLEEAEEENLAATEIPMRNIFPRYNWQQIWENLKANHEKFVLYREEEICCVKIELKDIRELPRRYWYLGNNSFLLHGFFNYRYLVVGEVGEERWFIGVPGVYQNQERVMAAIFGFPEFLPEPVENHFGYWCRMIEE